MDATNKIKEMVTIYDLLEYYKIKISNNRCACPLHNGNNPTAFVVNPDNNLYYCHTNCGGGDIFTFVEKIEEVSFEEAVRLVAKIFNIDITNLTISLHRIDLIKELNKWFAMIRSKQNNTMNTFDINTIGTLYDINSYRNFNRDILTQFGIKYCTENKRIIVPIHYQEQCVGVSMRRTDNNPAKWIHQPTDIKTRQLLYNYDNIVKLKPLIIVEGAWDVLNYTQYGYENVVSTFGAHMTNEQMILILQTTYDIILAYDSDKAGIQATNKAIELLHNKVNISIANIPSGKDAGELTQEELEASITNQLTIREWRVN